MGIIPDKNELLFYEKKIGYIHEVNDDLIRLSVFLEDNYENEKEGVFSKDLFKIGRAPEAGDEVWYHCWQEKNFQIGSCFEVIGKAEVLVSDEELSKAIGLVKKLKEQR